MDKPKRTRLTLSRREGDSIEIGPDITVTITEVRGGRVRLTVEAYSEVVVARTELLERDTVLEPEGGK